METGESGVHGTHAVRHVSKELNHELVNAIHRLLDMVENYVKGIQVRLKFATKTFRAQVISIVCLFVCLHHLFNLVTDHVPLLKLSIGESQQNNLRFLSDTDLSVG